MYSCCPLNLNFDPHMTTLRAVHTVMLSEVRLKPLVNPLPVQTQLNTGGVARLRCPDPQCDTFLSPTLLRCVLDEQQFERYGVCMCTCMCACACVRACVRAHVHVHTYMCTVHVSVPNVTVPFI